MSEDTPSSSPLIAACRDFVRHLAVEAQAAARQVVVNLATLVAMALLALSAAAACIVMGIVFATRGLHALIVLLVHSGWLADLLTSIILLALPCLVLVVIRHKLQESPQHPDSESEEPDSAPPASDSAPQAPDSARQAPRASTPSLPD